jgi:hypothetical protein
MKFSMKHDETGDTMVSAIIAIGIFVIIAYFASAATNRIMNTRRSLEAGASAREMDQLISERALKAIKDYAQSGCAKAATGTLNAAKTLGGSASLSVAKNFAFNDGSGSKRPAFFSSALSRCGGVNTTAGDVAKSNIHRCFNIANTLSAAESAKLSGTSFLKSKGAFIEIHAEIKDLNNDTPVACNQVEYVGTPATPSLPSAGLVGYYVIYWVVNQNGGPIYKSKAGVLYSNI